MSLERKSNSEENGRLSKAAIPMQYDTDEMQEYPRHLRVLSGNLNAVLRLLEIHEAIGGRGPGRRRDIEVLNRSAIVLLVACWESFVEDLAAEAFDVMLKEATQPETFPTKVLAIAARPLREAADSRQIWRLAGNSWRDVLREHRDTVFKTSIGRLNTPRPKQVDQLFEHVIGISAFSNEWKWKGMPNKRALSRLENLITRRGEIAHRVTAGPSIRKKYVEDSSELVHQLAAVASNAVCRFVEKQIGKTPWDLVYRIKPGKPPN